MAHASNNATWTNSAATPITAATLEAQENAVDQIYTTAYGSTSRTRPPSSYVYYTADSSTLAAGTDFIMAGGWSAYSDPDNMMTVSGGTISTPTIITAPISGMYQCEFHGVSSAVTGYIYARLLINADSAQTVTYRATNNSFAITTGFAAGEATHFHLSRPRLLNAGDKITAALYSNAAFILRATFFTQPFVTMWGIRYLGPV